MNPAVLEALMGGQQLPDFIRERGEAIRQIGRRPKFVLKTVNLDGHLHTPLHPPTDEQAASTAATPLCSA